ncbi:MAG: response regulator, partial [Bacteroidales bacterium]|nr:response regulator [Bacteroidales bacterium]
LINLISNAIKFTSKGSITIGYNIVDDEKNIEFYVEDTGMGIDENDMQKIFNSFVKLNTYISGTGLGLTICKNIVEQMKGSISVSSVKGEGSRFSFKIPYEPIFTEMAQPYNVGVSNDNDPVILVVEDNESNFILLSAILKSYSLLWAEDGPSALDMYYQHKPDLILMDIQLPGENGLVVTSKIRETDKKTPIIALTANAFESDKDVAMEAGCNEFLTKPVNFSTLKALIKKYLNK